MHARTQSNHYVIPAHLVHLVMIVLLVSTLMNAASVFFGMAEVESRESTDVVPLRLPVYAPGVAMELIDSDRYGMHDDNDWASIIPAGHGFVRFNGNDDDFYAVSMYHQMHCLNSFRKMFNGHRNESRADHDSQHALHCLSYLRQNVLCAADATLEPAFSARDHNTGKLTKAAYGSGVTHRCRDWTAVRKFVEQNHDEWREEEDIMVATEASAINAL